MDSLQGGVGRNHYPVVPVRYRRTGFPKITVFSCLTEVTGDLQKSDRI